MQSSPAPCHFLPLRCERSLQRAVLEYPHSFIADVNRLLQNKSLYKHTAGKSKLFSLYFCKIIRHGQSASNNAVGLNDMNFMPCTNLIGQRAVCESIMIIRFGLHVNWGGGMGY